MIKFPPQRVLVAVDMSEESMLAWEHGVFLRRKFGCQLEAAFVISKAPLPKWDKFPDFRIAPPGLRKSLLDRIGAKEKVVLAHGDPVYSLCRLARTRKADMIVIGPHHHSPLERLLNGSVTETLIRQSHVPVLAVHGRPRTISRVLAPVSGRAYSEAGFFIAAGVAAAFKARLDLMRVVPEEVKASSAARFSLEALIQKLPEKVRKTAVPLLEIRHGLAEEEILESAQRRELIVMAAHRKSLLDDLTHNMTAVKIIRHSTVPVLVIPEPRPGVLAPRWSSRAIVRTP
jgi:nucleotide-binding universal stress UspA family protein